ncbi:MAG: hypothetical protein H6745_25885 [Deltaproteobacteria bacterium]|nr:hypothetical protein [Deltaproteobacteria bacterium]
MVAHRVVVSALLFASALGAACGSDGGSGGATDATTGGDTAGADVTGTDATAAPDATGADDTQAPPDGAADTASPTDADTAGGGGTQQGSASDPVVLTLGTPYDGSVVAFGTSYYQFTTPGPDQGLYKVALTETHSDLRWELYSNLDVTAAGSFVGACDHSALVNDEVCGFSLQPETTYYLRVMEADGVGGGFTLLAYFDPGDDGPEITPLTLGERLTGQRIAPNDYRFYSFVAGSVDMRAVVSVLDGTADLEGDLFWVNDSGHESHFAVCDAVAGPGDEICASDMALFAGQTFYVRVTNHSDAHATFAILAEQGGGTAEGTEAAPVAVDAAADVARASTVDVEHQSWYRLDGLAAGATYTVSLTDASDVVDVAVYSDAGFSALICDDPTWGPGETTCTGLAVGSSLWVRVSARASLRGATFTLRAAKSPFEAIVMAELHQGVPIAANGVAYFSFWNGTLLGDSNEVDVYPGTGDLDLAWDLFADAALEALITACDTSTDPSPEACHTPGFGPNTQYFLRVTNKSAVAGTFDLVVY